MVYVEIFVTVNCGAERGGAVVNIEALGKKIYTNYFLTTGPRFNKLHIQGAI
ncbi:unnamed protein product [Brassica oleracea]